MEQAVRPFLTCVKCGGPFEESDLSVEGRLSCTHCRTPMEVVVFPAIRAANRGISVGSLEARPDDATCFFHGDKRASFSCRRCGRFICALCDIEISGHHLCPSCVSSGAQKGAVQRLQRQQLLYDKIALLLTVYPILFVFTIYFTIVTAPVGIFVALRYWNYLSTPVKRSKYRFVVALVVGILELLAWAAGGTALYFYLRTKRGA